MVDYTNSNQLTALKRVSKTYTNQIRDSMLVGIFCKHLYGRQFQLALERRRRCRTPYYKEAFKAQTRTISPAYRYVPGAQNIVDWLQKQSQNIRECYERVYEEVCCLGCGLSGLYSRTVTRLPRMSCKPTSMARMLNPEWPEWPEWPDNKQRTKYPTNQHFAQTGLLKGKTLIFADRINFVDNIYGKR